MHSLFLVFISFAAERICLINTSNICLINSLAFAEGKPRARTTGSPAVYKVWQANINNSYSHDTDSMLRPMKTNPLCCWMAPQQHLYSSFSKKRRSMLQVQGRTYTVCFLSITTSICKPFFIVISRSM